MTIANFMHTLQYENTLIREQIHLYINYLSFFHASHENYLQKLVQKIQHFQEEMEKEIKNEQGENMDMTNIDLECVFASSENFEVENILQQSEQVLEDAEKIIEQAELVDLVESADPVDLAESADNTDLAESAEQVHRIGEEV
jgi:hypothetical protein